MADADVSDLAGTLVTPYKYEGLFVATKPQK